MPTTVYDSSLLTKRKMAKVNSYDFNTRIANGKSGFNPQMGNYDASSVPVVDYGNVRTYTKILSGCVQINNGCPCGVLAGAELNCGGTN
jgi:hypothetical protein